MRRMRTILLPESLRAQKSWLRFVFSWCVGIAAPRQTAYGAAHAARARSLARVAQDAPRAHPAVLSWRGGLLPFPFCAWKLPIDFKLNEDS